MSVLIGMPVYGHIPPKTTMSLVRTLYECGVRGIDCDVVMEVAGIVTVSRDAVLDSFLKGTAQKLFWIDSDVVWEPDAFFRMLGLSTLRDVVVASYPSKVDGRLQFAIDMDFPADRDDLGLTAIRGAGLGFTIMDRKVCEAVANSKPQIHDTMLHRDVRAVFRVDTINGKRRSEDMAFFADIRDLGHTVWLDPSISLGHVGSKEWHGSPLSQP